MSLLDLLPFPAIKLPKLKKLRQWSHDSLANLTQLTHRSNNNVNPKLKTRFSYDENTFPTNGISTISSAIREQRIDPKKDNYGLYALKCDRSSNSSVANARRGILLNLPTTMIKSKAEINSFQSMERTHEVFQSCERIVDVSSGIMYDGATSSGASGAESKPKVEPPPRRKKRQTATRTIVSHPAKQLKKPPMPPRPLKQANQNVLKTETLEKNDSGLYRISETAKLSIEEPKKKEHVVMMVKPKVQKAVAVKSKPVQQQVAKVKSYELSKHQRKSSVGNVVVKPQLTKRFVPNEKSGGSFKSGSSVDIFQSNKLKDQRKIFDEFDALFDKSKDYPDLSEATPETAFSKLNALKHSSPSLSDESGSEDRIPMKALITSFETQDFVNKNLTKSLPSKKLENVEVSTKPKIVHEQPKAPPGIIKKKILYYDDKHEFQQLIMNQSQSTTIINNHFNATVLPSSGVDNNAILASSQGSVPISCSPTPHSVDESTGRQLDLNGNEDVSKDYRNPKANDTNSNSLRIFSNEGIFVFNL